MLRQVRQAVSELPALSFWLWLSWFHVLLMQHAAAGWLVWPIIAVKQPHLVGKHNKTKWIISMHREDAPDGGNIFIHLLVWTKSIHYLKTPRHWVWRSIGPRVKLKHLLITQPYICVICSLYFDLWFVLWTVIDWRVIDLKKLTQTFGQTATLRGWMYCCIAKKCHHCLFDNGHANGREGPSQGKRNSSFCVWCQTRRI